MRMHEQFSPMRAAIDIGSNTIHIVVARSTSNDLDIVEDQVALVRIGESVNATGEISQEKAEATIDLLKEYKALAKKHAPNPIFVVATQPIHHPQKNPPFFHNVHL